MPIASSAATEFPRVALHLPEATLAGTVRYDRRRRLLELVDDYGESEVLSLDMSYYGYVTAPGEAWIKDWSEHAGLADALVMADVVMSVESVRVGPFASRAYRCLVLDPEAVR